MFLVIIILIFLELALLGGALVHLRRAKTGLTGIKGDLLDLKQELRKMSEAINDLTAAADRITASVSKVSDEVRALADRVANLPVPSDNDAEVEAIVARLNAQADALDALDLLDDNLPPVGTVSAAAGVTGSTAALGDNPAPGTVATIPPGDPAATTQVDGVVTTPDAALADTSNPDTVPGLTASPPAVTTANAAAADENTSSAVDGPLGPVDSEPDATHKLADGEMPQL